jgi:uncharacterized protein
MTLVTLGQASSRQHGFYVPQFEVRVEGVGLPRDVLRDVTQLTYRDNIKEIDGFEITVNNWDDGARDFKYVGSETPESLRPESAKTPEGMRHQLFQPCGKEVEVWMGYLGDLRLMLKGTFTTMEPNFPGGGAPTLNVRGLNALHQLRRKQYTYAWPDLRDSDIAEDIAKLKDKESGKKRFPLPIVTDPKARAAEKEIPYVAQKNQYDIDFLLERARARGYVVFVREEKAKTPGAKPERKLYFGPSHEGQSAALRPVTYHLEWGKSLADFKPTLTTANQVKSVTVNGWNRQSRQPISATVTLDDKKLNVNRDLHELLNRCDAREEVVVDEPVFTPAQARERAVAILMDRQKEMVKASATTVGLPDLRAGQRVRIGGVGARFNGTYFVTESTHTIGDGGYTTKFNARREEEG